MTHHPRTSSPLPAFSLELKELFPSGIEEERERKRRCVGEGGGGSSIFGASLSEPHTSGTALRKCVNIRTFLLACGHIP